MRQPHLGREKMCVMTSFLWVKQVKSYPGSFVTSSPPLWMCTKGNALYLLLGSMTRAQRGCSVVRSLCALSVCLLCVVKVPGAGSAHRAANANSSYHIFCHSVSAPPPASLVLPFHVFALSPCGALLFLHSHFFLREHRSLTGKVEAASFLLNVRHLGHSLFSTVGLDAGVW